jgi:hypothetical protein
LIIENRNQCERKIDEFDYKLEQNVDIRRVYDKKIEDLKSLFSGKVFVK